MSKYAVVFEGDEATGYSSYVLDLPGVIATGKTLDKTRERMRSPIHFHLRGLRADGDPIPQPACVVEMIEVA